jgi:hypothetical protein
VSRKRKHERIVRITCTDPRHQDHRVLYTLKLGQDSEGNPLLYEDVFEHDFYWPPIIKSGPEKWPGDGQEVMVFRCTCGRDVQRKQHYLSDLAEQRFAASPGATRVDLPICTL